jgi:hypothetical protein
MEVYQQELAEVKAAKETAKAEVCKAKEVENKAKFECVATIKENLHSGNEDFYATPQPLPCTVKALQIGQSLQWTIAYLELLEDKGVGQSNVAMDVDGEFDATLPLTTDAEDMRPLKKAKTTKGKEAQRYEATNEEMEIIAPLAGEEVEEVEHTSGQFLANLV